MIRSVIWNQLMVKLRHTFLKRNGKKVFVILPIEDFDAAVKFLRGMIDPRPIAQARRRAARFPPCTLTEFKRRMGLLPAHKRG
jgi:hypothetical protein